ncbi:50S ribosomal protein L30 [Nitrosopumilus sp. b1]|uniref:50S ribosomal protein L30 n=1 Tax=Nitrosopumilus sp. b1 TaxID=2109907 RepID=UPI0015F42BBE|nr:50S ribosomal protein L30 [Nitrosopumilus sp. b1]KAF6243177.1 50S ribosomal protein L30 [Nitrosopumilus sp. b1]
MAKAYLVVRIKGQVDVPYWAEHTLKLLKLEKRYRATIIPAKENTLGMLNKVKHYVSWQEVDTGLAKELLDKKARKSGYKKITSEDLGEIGFKSIDELATSLAEGKTSLTKLKPLKPWFALAPPRHGFKKSTKRMSGQKGVLGQNNELATIVRNMI